MSVREDNEYSNEEFLGLTENLIMLFISSHDRHAMVRGSGLC